MVSTSVFLRSAQSSCRGNLPFYTTAPRLKTNMNQQHSKTIYGSVRLTPPYVTLAFPLQSVLPALHTLLHTRVTYPLVRLPPCWCYIPPLSTSRAHDALLHTLPAPRPRVGVTYLVTYPCYIPLPFWALHTPLHTCYIPPVTGEVWAGVKRTHPYSTYGVN